MPLVRTSKNSGSREPLSRWQRRLLFATLPYPNRLRLALRLAQRGRPLIRPLLRWLPSPLQNLVETIPSRPVPRRSQLAAGVHAAQGTPRWRVGFLSGCAQQVLGESINLASVRLLRRLGAEVHLLPHQGCCGALTYHTGERHRSLALMRRLIALWDEAIAQRKLDAIVTSTSGCTVVMQDYPHIFAQDPAYAKPAARVASQLLDITQAAAELDFEAHLPPDHQRSAPGQAPGQAPRQALRVAYHEACSLQHGQNLRHEPRALLQQAGHTVLEVAEGHLCCGSAGTYHVLHPQQAAQLGQQKATHIARLNPDVIASGNLGCIEQLARYTQTPHLHTVELLDWASGGPKPASLAAPGSTVAGAAAAQVDSA